jgi:integrase
MKKLDWPVVTDNDPEPYEADEVVSLIAKADSRMALVIRTFVGTGMRDMELAHLTWEDIDFKHKLIHIQPKPCHCRKCGSVGVWKPKAKEGTRNIPLGDGLLADLAKIKTGEGLVFPSPRDGKVDGKLLAKLGSVAKKAGVAAPKLHRFRDTFITNKIRDGVDIRTVQKWAGHKDIRRGWLRTAWPLALRLTARTNAISLPKVCEIANSVRGTCLWRIDTVAVKRSDPRNVLQLS